MRNSFLLKDTSVIEYRPVAIYYGKNIDIKNELRMHRIVVTKGNKEFEVLIDRGSEKYEMGYRPLSADIFSVK